MYIYLLHQNRVDKSFFKQQIVSQVRKKGLITLNIMNIFISLTQVLFIISAILFAGVVFFSFAKLLKKNYFHNWKILDYVSVGYAEHLYKKYILDPMTRLKSIIFKDNS